MAPFNGNRPLIRKLTPIATVALAVASASPSRTSEAADKDDLPARVLSMTGTHTKIVWEHQLIGPYQGADGAAEAKYELMGFDTAEDKPRLILPGPASYAGPLIIRDGSRIVFTDGPPKRVYVVDWRGENKEFLFNGFATCTWVDPRSGVHWVYATQGGWSAEAFRHQLDNPAVREVVWNKTRQSLFRVSADGTRGAGEFSWPNAGVAILPNVSWKQYGTGCNTDIAPDNSYRVFHMERGGGAAGIGHKGVAMYDAGGVNMRRIPFNIDPGRPLRPSWIPRWSTDVRFLTLSWPDFGPGQENQNLYLGEFDDKFTRVKRWVQITDRPGKDIYGYAWLGRGLGSYSGEAPLVVEIPPGLTPKGQWQWDYGDGTRERSASGKHTYTKAGKYTITARRGEAVLRGRVTVRDRRPPGVTSARLLDGTHVRVSFDEPVQLKDAKVSLSSGAAVKGFRLDHERVQLTVELHGPLSEDDALVLDGVYDRAQEPNALTKNRVAIARPPWPSDRSNLVFLWETTKARNICFDPDGNTFRPITLDMVGMARLDRFGIMLFEGGAVRTPNTGGGIVRACTQANEFSVEATITPAAAEQGDVVDPARILTCNSYPAGRERVNFALHQEGARLVFYLRNRPADIRDASGAVRRVEMCTLAGGTPNHIMISYGPANLACHLNGRQAKRTDEVKGKLSWGRPRPGAGVEFGGSPQRESAKAPWKGKLEGVAIYSRAVGADEARRNYAEYAKRLAGRQPLPQIKVQTTLVAKSRTPDPAAIAPYHSALAVYEYDVVRVLEGTYNSKKLRAARWALVHKKKTGAARAKLRASSTLILEKLSDHSELEGEVLQDTLPENFELTLYVEPAMPDPRRERPTGSIRGQLSLARSYLAAGMKDRAKAILVKIVEEHPEAEQIAEARKLLEGL